MCIVENILNPSHFLTVEFVHILNCTYVAMLFYNKFYIQHAIYSNVL